MTTFFIAPYEPKEWKTSQSDLRINPDWYRARLLEKWPYVIFFDTSPNVYLLNWELSITQDPSGSVGGIGGLQTNQQIVSMSTPFEEYFLWHRQIIPGKYRLYLFNDSSWDSLELTADTTIEDIQDFLEGRT